MNFIQKYPKVVLAVACAVTVFAVISLFRSGGHPRFVKEDVGTIFQDLVWQVEQLADVLEDGSRVVVLELDPAIRAHGDRNYKRIFGALEKGGLSIQHIERLVVDESQGWDPYRPGFPYFEFVRVAAAYPDVDAVIALCGPPYFSRNAQWPETSGLPKLLVAGGAEGSSAAALFDEGWLYAATVPRTVKREGKPLLIYELLRKE